MSDGERPDVDRWLRRGLEPSGARRRRIVESALEPTLPPRPGGRGRALTWAGVTVLVALLVGGLLWRGLVSEPPGAVAGAAAPFRIANFGELVTVVDPAAGGWLVGPTREIDASSPRLIIQLGGTHAP